MSRSSAEERRDQHERPWTDANVPDQGGKIFIVTGANSGPGFEGGDYFGPSRWGGLRDPAVRVQTVP